MESGKGPYPVTDWRKKIAANVMPPMIGTYSGELTAGVQDLTLGAVRIAGEIDDVFMSVEAMGKDDSNELNISGEVLINGVSCLSTVPMLAHVSGEASQQKTTVVIGDTGMTAAVMNRSTNKFSPGDIISAKFTIERTASPTTEIKNPVIVANLLPIK